MNAPPQNVEAEETVLGAMIIAEKAIDACAPILAPGDFYRRANGLIYQAILELRHDHEPVDAITLVQRLDTTARLQDAGGQVRVHELAALVPATANAAHWARIVRDAALKRHALGALADATQTLHNGALAADALDRLTVTFAELAANARPLQERPHTWQAIPLTQDIDENEPDRILGLIYPDKRHLVYGEPESLKSWLALCAIAETVIAGRHALLIDHEMSARVTRNRLQQLGLTQPHLELVLYLHPTETLDTTSGSYLRGLLDQHNPALVVIDAFTGTLATQMLDDNSTTEVEKWWQTIGSTLWGPEQRALLVIDHVVKDKDNRGRWPSGSKRKLEGADVALSLETVKRLGRKPGQDGHAKIRVQKDRPAWLPYPRPGDLHLHVTDTGGITWRISPAVEPEPDKPFRHTGYMERISRYLEEHGKSTSRDITFGVKGRDEHIRTAIEELVVDGYVTQLDGPNRTKFHVLEKPYREIGDDA